MILAELAPLARWESFYVIVGTAAAALTGLQFVVMALVADVEQRGSTATIDAFATPTIVHFSVALLLSAALTAPWDDLTLLGRFLGLVGGAGVVYTAIVIRRARQQTGYAPVFEDWLWHAILPLLGYGAIVGATIALPDHERVALFVLGAVALLLVFIGIHNAWDTVTFITLRHLARDGAERDATARPPKTAPARGGGGTRRRKG